MTRQTFSYFLHRLPRIVLFIVLFYILFFVGDKLFYRFAPPSYFLRYTSVNVAQDEPLYEHEALPTTFCREKRGNYPITGYRIFYKLNEAGDRSKGKQVAQRPITNQITASKCVDIKITTDQYDHAAGKYFFRTYINFKVNGVDKQVTNESNTYLVEKKPLTPSDIQLKILDLEKEIQDLKLQLQRLGVTTSPDPTPITVNSSTKSSTTTKNSTVNQRQMANNTDNSQQEQANPKPTGLRALPLVDGTLDFLGL